MDGVRLNIFADDARLIRLYNCIKNKDDAVALQAKSDNFANWVDKW